ncbi:MAG: Gx transporter family protein [Lachnospiraceae bacterium]|nr:Gx transporter family protein [Lachnospiraceae bacterium]
MRSNKLAFMALMLALSLVTGYVEYLIPIPTGIPGIKLGLANIVTVFLILRGQYLEAFWILFIRVILSGILFGNPVSVIFGMTGGLAALAIMILLERSHIKLSIIGVSMSGAVVHNMGQIMVSFLMLGTKKVFYYLPFLMIAGLITGFITGWICQLLFERLPGDGKFGGQ